MSFGQEVKDFISGYKSGSEVLESRGRQKNQAAEYENKRQFTEEEIAKRNSPLAGGGQAIPEVAGGGTPGDPRYRDAISGIESGGNYQALGPLTGDPKDGRDRAYGRYQIMGKNIPAWTKAALGTAMTPQEFLANEKAQDATFDHIFGGYVSKYGERGAAQAWFGGPGSVGKEARKDVLGTSVKSYGDMFLANLAKTPKTDATATAAATSAPASKAPPAADAATAPLTPEEEPQKQAWYTPVGDAPIPDNPYAVATVEPALVAPEEEWGQRPVFAQSGGAIPEPVQHFADGGTPAVDPYNRARAYTQQFTPSAPPTSVPRRISFPTAASTAAPAMQTVDGMTPSQLALKNARDKITADRAAAAAAVPAAAAPAPVAAAPAGPVFRGYGSWQPAGHSREVWVPSRGPPQDWKPPGQSTTPASGSVAQPTQFAAGGAIPDRNAHFKELLRQESLQHPSGIGDHEGGESARDRAARRISAEKGFASSTAYNEHSEYWQKPGTKQGGDSKKKAAPSKEKTSSTAPVHVRHPPNPAVGVPEPAEDRATRFRESELVPGPSSVRTAREVGNDPRGTPDPLGPAPIANDPRGTPDPLEPAIPLPAGPAGTPTSPYELAHPPRGTIKVPGASVVYVPPPPPAPVIGKPSGPAQPRPTIGTTKIAPTAEAARRPGPPQPQGPPAPPPSGVDPARTAADVADTRRRMELVQTAPAANKMVPVLLDPATGQLHDPASMPPDEGEYPDVPPQDWSQVQDPRQGYGRAVVRSVLDPTGRRLLGYAGGGVIPEPGEPGYNEYVGSRNASAAPSSETTSSLPPQQQQERMQPTPRLMSDVAKALDGGVRFLTQHFGLQQDGAVPTPEGQQAQQDGARRFAEGEGATTPQEIQAIDDRIDPERQMSEGDRQMTRTAKIVSWYLERGRKEDASAAAAGLLQYGAQRVSQIGSLAAAAYRNGDVEGAAKALQSAYQMIPDGGAMNVQIDPSTQQLVVTHTDDQGKETQTPLKPEDLPGIIQGVQDKSLYWKQIMTLADPEGVHQRDRAKLSEDAWTRQHGVTRGEDVSDAETKRQQQVSDAELKRKQDLEDATVKAKAEAEKAATERRQKLGDTADTRKFDVQQKLLDASLEKLKQEGKQVDYGVVAPALGELQAAVAAKDDVAANKAWSKMFDALPAGVDKGKWMTEMGYPPESYQYTPPTPGETPPAPGAKRGKDPRDGSEHWFTPTGPGGKWEVVPGS